MEQYTCHNQDEIKEYQQSMKKFDELVAKHGYEKGKELHLEWLKETKRKEEYKSWKKALSKADRKDYETIFEGEVNIKDINKEL